MVHLCIEIFISDKYVMRCEINFIIPFRLYLTYYLRYCILFYILLEVSADCTNYGDSHMFYITKFTRISGKIMSSWTEIY